MTTHQKYEKTVECKVAEVSLILISVISYRLKKAKKAPAFKAESSVVGPGGYLQKASILMSSMFSAISCDAVHKWWHFM